MFLFGSQLTNNNHQSEHSWHQSRMPTVCKQQNIENLIELNCLIRKGGVLVCEWMAAGQQANLAI